MRLRYFFQFLFVLPLLLCGQTRVDADEIIEKINMGEDVAYSNAEISGDLDFTKIDRKYIKGKKGRRSSFFERIFSFADDNNEVNYLVKTPLKFENCTFTGDVLAYYHDDFDELTHNVSFSEDVVFSNCTFREKSAFKYSDFYESCSFSGSKFYDEALFKYTEFDQEADFSNCTFSRDANFKYVKFPDYADFSDCDFEEQANFKYSKFYRGISFENSIFSGYADFKYAELDDPVNLKNVEFNGDTDFKYTKVENQRMVKYLLKNR